MEYLVILGAIVALSGNLTYVRNTILGRSAPHRVTFFLWAAAPMIVVAAALVQGVTWAVVPVFMAGFGPLLVFLASFTNKKAVWKLDKFDWLCGFFSVLALILWGITKEPNIAILFGIISDGLAGIPTLKKCWTHPETETVWAYMGGAFSAYTGLLAAKAFTFTEISFPLYLLILDISIIVLYATRKGHKKGYVN